MELKTKYKQIDENTVMVMTENGSETKPIKQVEGHKFFFISNPYPCTSDDEFEYLMHQSFIDRIHDAYNAVKNGYAHAVCTTVPALSMIRTNHQPVIFLDNDIGEINYEKCIQFIDKIVYTWQIRFGTKNSMSRGFIANKEGGYSDDDDDSSYYSMKDAQIAMKNFESLADEITEKYHTIKLLVNMPKDSEYYEFINHFGIIRDMVQDKIRVNNGEKTQNYQEIVQSICIYDNNKG